MNGIGSLGDIPTEDPPTGWDDTPPSGPLTETERVNIAELIARTGPLLTTGPLHHWEDGYSAGWAAAMQHLQALIDHNNDTAARTLTGLIDELTEETPAWARDFLNDARVPAPTMNTNLRGAAA